MKTITTIVLFFILAFSTQIFAGWDIKSNYNESVSDVFFINENIGWMVTGSEGGGSAYSGLILKTIDGGNTWSPLNIGQPSILYAVQFVDENIGWAAGYRGLLLKTIDGGETWFKQETNVSSDIKNIHFYDENIGWAIGGRSFIIHTVDGGETWIRQTADTGNQDLSSIFFLDNKNGWAGGNAGVIFHTSDGGENWELQNSGNSHWVYGIQFLNLDVGYAFGSYGGLYSTKDGGSSWQLDTLQSAFYSRDMHFFDEGSGIIINPQNEILRTSDGGLTWELETLSFQRTDGSKVNTSFAGLFFLDNSNGFLFCGNGPLLKTADAGNSWEQLAFNNNFTHLSVVHGFSKDVALVGGYYGMYKTIDGGLSWDQKISRNQMVSNSFNAMKFNSNSFGVAVTGTYKIFYSQDGGENWAYDSIGINNGLKGVELIGNYSYACGLSNNLKGVILRSGGIGNWEQVHEEDGCYFNDIDFPTVLEGWAVGSNAKIIHTSDGGNTWSQINIEGISSGEFKDVDFINDKIGWISGLWSAQLLHTKDGGQSWSIVKIPKYYGSTDLGSINFIDENIGWVTAQGDIWKTINGGETWERSQLPAIGTDISNISMVNDKIGWAVSNNRVFYTEDGGGALLDIESATAGLEHDFDNGEIEKENWVLSSTNSSSSWKIGNLENKSFSGIESSNVYSAIIEAPPGDFNEVIKTPKFDLDMSETILEFYIGYDGTNLEDKALELQVSTNNYPLWTWHTFLNDNDDWKWRKVQINLAEFSGSKNIQVAWAYSGNNGGYVALDGIKFLTASEGVLTDLLEFEHVELVTEYSLLQNYPNPFNPSTVIEFNIPNNGNVSLKVFNILGQEVAELLNNEIAAGYHKINFDGTNLSSGIYFYRIFAGDFVKTNKMLLIK